MIDLIPRTALACALALTLTACGGGDSDTDEAAPAAEAADTEAASETPQASEAAPSAGTMAPVTVAEIDGWKKGMTAELEAVRSAGTKLKEMEERVPAEVVEALKPRAPELRKQTLELAAERLKSAGV